MKKSVYAILGVTLVIVASVLRTLTGGSLDLVLLVGLGLALVIASADVPTRAARSP